MAIDLTKAIQQAGVFPSLFQRQPKQPSFVEMAASYGAPSSLFKWQGQKQDYSSVAPAELTLSSVSPEIERAYQQEKSRVTQLADQDPLAKKYRVADLTKAYNAASTPEEKEKIGLEIWATTNPRLAQKLQPGQLGYEQVQSVAAAQSPLGGIMKAAGDMQFADKISFGAVPATDFGVSLNTPLTGVQIPAVPQIGVAEAFKGITPGGISFTEAAELFKPEVLSQTQQALLKQAFEKGLKK